MRSLMKSWILLFSLVAATTATATPATSEDVQVGDVNASISMDCHITFTLRDGRRAHWDFPATGPCYFAKNHLDGKVKVYQHTIRNRPNIDAHVFIAISGKKNPSGECEGMHVAMMVKGSRVLVGVPPYPAYAMCASPKGGLDEKNYADAWFQILEHGKYEEVIFPAK
jgi:hypothetical protein